MIPNWLWLTIDAVILLGGAAGLGLLIFRLVQKSQALVPVINKLTEALQQLETASNAKADYERPTTDLETSFVQAYGGWEKRKARQERLRQDRQRRLIERLRK